MYRIGTIELIGMEFWANHGCLEEEKSKGNLFVVDFKGRTDLAKACESDNLEDTLDYGKIYQIIRREMEVHSDLLEHLAGRMIRAIETVFPEFMEFSISIAKKNPPVGGKCAWSEITLEGGIDKADDRIQMKNIGIE